MANVSFGVPVVDCVVFFFQAEDGIRDLTVTGVQTCALPISLSFVSLNDITMMQATPVTWTALLDSGWPSVKLTKLKALVGGEAVSRTLADRDRKSVV